VVSHLQSVDHTPTRKDNEMSLRIRRSFGSGGARLNVNKLGPSITFGGRKSRAHTTAGRRGIGGSFRLFRGAWWKWGK
jgi:hypothetical protein